MKYTKQGNIDLIIDMAFILLKKTMQFSKVLFQTTTIQDLIWIQQSLYPFLTEKDKWKGKFYTSKCIVNLIAEMIEPYKGKDLCSLLWLWWYVSVLYIESHHRIFYIQACKDEWRAS